MKLRIRGKLIGILAIAAVVPLCIAIIAIDVFGYRYYKRERGRLFQSSATHLASTLNLYLSKEMEKLKDWVALVRPIPVLTELNAAERNSQPAAQRRAIDAIDAQWQELNLQSPILQQLLTNSLANQLVALQTVNPLIAEIFITDQLGRVVATSRKTSDYYQGDELWWQRAMRVRHGLTYIEGVVFDESAKVYSIDLCTPIRDPKRPHDQPLGVLKAVIDASPLFASVPHILRDERPTQQIILASGDLVSDMFHESFAPTHRIEGSAAAEIATGEPGWRLLKLDHRGARLVGYAPLNLGEGLVDKGVERGSLPMFVIVHDDAALVLAPVRHQLWVLACGGFAILIGFTLSGYYIATRKIIAPIEALRSAAKTISESARLEEMDDTDMPLRANPECRRVLERVHQIKTGDELEDLAGDFGTMACRVLTYYEKLEEEIATKTAEIQRDLQFAREFQEALMPRQYPQIPSQDSSDDLQLRFHHIYRPTSSVGGDFFDVVKLSDHQAGVFIADVMGHGARSALVTAILRTLLQDLALVHGDDPSKLLQDINKHFFDITSQSNQFVFVSAFYLVLDTQRATATYAAAGHPSPYLADRVNRKVRAVIDKLEHNPALGLYRDSKYTTFTSFIKPGDVFILFTDGLFEATRATGEDFGRDRLRSVIEQNIDLRVDDLCETVLDAVNAFTVTGNLPDDICLVGVEINATAPPKPVERIGPHVGTLAR